MRVDRRRAIGGLLSLFVSAGCLGRGSAEISFGLRIENQDTRPRELSVVVDHLTEGTVYDETRRLDPGTQFTEPAVAETPGRYRIGVTDMTTDEDRTAERNVELRTGAGFCGWFVVRATDESVVATVPRCPEAAENETADDPANGS